MNTQNSQGMISRIIPLLQNFDQSKLIEKQNRQDISDEQITKLLNDIYDLEEDLIILDCYK